MTMTLDLEACLKIAKENGVIVEAYMTNPPTPIMVHAPIAKFVAFANHIAREAAAAERAKAVAICEMLFADAGWNSHYKNAADSCANAIRSMGQEEGNAS